MPDIPNWIIAAGTGLPVVGGVVGWFAKHFWSAGVDEGHRKALAEQQMAATQRMFQKLDAQMERISRLERIVQQQREVLIREGYMVPSDTQTGIRSRD